jgi:hypothetical protein
MAGREGWLGYQQTVSGIMKTARYGFALSHCLSFTTLSRRYPPVMAA